MKGERLNPDRPLPRYYRRLERIVWKPIDWYPESPDQYPDGLPVAKPEMAIVPFPDGSLLQVVGYPLAEAIEVRTFGSDGTESGDVIRITADKERLLDFVDALLYVQRRTHEADWEGPDDGLEDQR